MTVERPDVIVIVTDQERAAPPYEPDELTEWRRRALPGTRWFEDNGVSFGRHYTGSLACVPSRPTMLTGHYPDVHGVTETDGLGKMYDDSRMRWLRPGEVPTLGHWFRAAGYDTHYDGKWHLSHADLVDESSGQALTTNDDDGVIDRGAVQAYLDADPLGPFGFSGWVGPEPHGPSLANTGFVRDPLLADRVVAWLEERYARRRAGDTDALRPFLLVAGFVNPHDIVFAPVWLRRGSPLAPSDADPPPVPPSPTDDEDLSNQPGGPDRLPGLVPVDLRACTGDRADLPVESPGLPRSLPPAPRRGRRPPGSGPPGGERRGERQCVREAVLVRTVVAERSQPCAIPFLGR